MNHTSPSPSAPRTRRLRLGPVLLIAAAACSGDGAGSGAALPGAGPDEAAAGPSIRDSAGVRIVENPRHAPDSTAWWIDTVPVLQVGHDERMPDPYLFSSVAGANWLSDGTLAVADATAPEIRIFDAAGEYLRGMVRRGEGPGEYTRIGSFFVLPGDTVVVRSGYDGWPVSVLTPEGEYVRAWPLPDPPERDDPAAPYSTSPYVRALFSDGSALVSYLARDMAYRDQGAERPRTPVLFEMRSRFMRVDPGGRIVADYGEQVTARAIFYHSGDRFSAGFQHSQGLPQPSFAVHGTELYWADGERFEVRVFGPDGRLTRIVRKEHQPDEVPASWGEDMWHETQVLLSEVAWLADVPPPPLPPHAPAIDRLTLDDAGNLWVRSRPSASTDTPRWFIFGPDGALRYSLRTNLLPVRISENRVLAVVRSDLHVESAAVFPLHRQQP